MNGEYDAILIVAFGGPEKPEDVLPFLENVTRGRNVPRQRLLAVAEHYNQLGGASPINAQVRRLIQDLATQLKSQNIPLPLYWGNRNWHPFLADTIGRMADDGVRRGLALVLSAHSSYSSCRQYLENIEEARQAVAPRAPRVDKIRVFYNHPEFIAALAECVQDAVERIPEDRRRKAQIAYTAHSLPQRMAGQCDYVTQLTETSQLVSERLGIDASRWRLVYQSRSGRPSDPWLEPDIGDHLRTLKQQAVHDVVVAPIGFLSDHLEVLYDLDIRAQQVCQSLDMNMFRAATVGSHPLFLAALGDLIEERLTGRSDRKALGPSGPRPDTCPEDCCLKGARG